MLDSRLLTGSKVCFTTPVEDDLRAVTAWHQNEDFLRSVSYEEAVPQTVEKVRAWYLSSNPGETRFGVRELDKNALVGYVALQVLSWPHRNAELSLGMAPETDYTAYGADAVRLALGFAFRELNLHRLQAKVFSYNERELAMLQRLGFTVEGTLREFIRRDGKWFNMVLLGMLAREWRTG